MQRLPFSDVKLFVVSLLLFLLPAIVLAQSEPPKPGAPPVGQVLVSEGDFAVKLGAALAVVTTDDEVEAESKLGELGISPRNGWIADYPVTPDIIVELQDSVANAADAKKIPMGKDEALKKLTYVTAGLGLSVRPYAAATAYAPTPASCENYPNPIAINNTYVTEGPPVVTYYCPPPDYYYLYSWVPCPFWWFDLWFPGFFILNDFHRVVHIRNRVVVITNHFNDLRTHHAFRIDPVERFRGKTFAGIGVAQPRDFIPTGVPRSERTIFNGPRAPRMPAGPPPSRGGERISPVPRGGMISPVPHGGERTTPPAGGVRVPIEREQKR